MRLYDRCRKKLDNASYVFWRSSLSFHSSNINNNNNINGNRITFIQKAALSQRYLSFHLFCTLDAKLCRLIYSVYMSRIWLDQFYFIKRGLNLCKLHCKWKSLSASGCFQVSLCLLSCSFPLPLSFVHILTLSLFLSVPLSLLFPTAVFIKHLLSSISRAAAPAYT